LYNNTYIILEKILKNGVFEGRILQIDSHTKFVARSKPVKAKHSFMEFGMGVIRKYFLIKNLLYSTFSLLRVIFIIIITSFINDKIIMSPAMDYLVIDSSNKYQK